MRTYKKTQRTHRWYKWMIFLLIIVTSFGVYGIHSYAREKADNNSIENHRKDSRLLKEIRNTLEENGYDNSGVTLTKVMDTDGSYTYTALVHHQNIDLEDDVEVGNVYMLLMEMEGAKAVTITFKIF